MSRGIRRYGPGIAALLGGLALAGTASALSTPALPGVTVQTPVLPALTVNTPTLPPSGITVSTQPIPPLTVETPSVPAVTVTTPAVPPVDADVPPPAVPTVPGAPKVTLPGGGTLPIGSQPPTTGTAPGASTGVGAASSGTPAGGHGGAGGDSTAGQGSTPASAPVVRIRSVSQSSPAGSPGNSTGKRRHGLAQLGENVIDALPTAILVALVGLVLIAGLMSINAYLQGRRARRLNTQREGLLDDVGVLQSALLPEVPERVGELAVSVGYRPAQGLAAGGDFYDVFPLDDARTAFILGDVSGHGRESLIHAALVRYTLRTLMGEGHALGEVLARADRYLESDMSSNFATVIVATYDRRNAELRYAKAGHEPPLISGVDNLDEETACPLGLRLGESWPEFSHTLRAGETVCLYTDGLKEARKGGEELGRAHIQALLAEGLDAPALIERVERDADSAFDDLAAVVLNHATPESPIRFPRLPRRGGHTSTPTSPATTATPSATLSTSS
jgi:Stage II sporulation protein E (SpoIIE)